MNEQRVILSFLLIVLGATMWLYFLKAKKQVTYKGDERWQMIQLKANQVANIANWILAILIAIGTTITLVSDKEIVFTLTRVTILGTLYIGMRNLLELVAIKYFDRQL